MTRGNGLLAGIVCTLWVLPLTVINALPGRRRTTLAAHTAQSTGICFRGHTGPPVSLQVIRRLKGPVIDSNNPDAAGIKYGFETGMTVKFNGIYHLIIDEFSGGPESLCMRIGYWTSLDAVHWKLVSTLKQPSCKPRKQTGLPYEAVWGPTLTYDRKDGRWNLFYLGYYPHKAWNPHPPHDGSGVATIWRSVSSVGGVHGIGGPYEDKGIILRGDDSFFAYRVGDRWLALFGRNWQVGLAAAPNLGGPWTPLSASFPLPINPVFIENPIVTHWRNLYLAVYDMDVLSGTPSAGPRQRDSHNVGFTYSRDGIHWATGGRIKVQPDGAANWCSVMRTPLGLVPEGNDEFMLLYTCRLKREYFAVNMVRVKLQIRKSQ